MAPIFVFVSVFGIVDLLAGGWLYYANSKPETGYQFDYKQYTEGKLYWWQVRNDEEGFLKKLEHCKNMGICSWWTSVLCKAESFKTFVNFYAIAGLKAILNSLHQNFLYLVMAVVLSAVSIMFAYCLDKTIFRRLISYIKVSRTPDRKELPPREKAKVRPNTDHPSKTSEPSFPYKHNVSRKSHSMHKPDLTKNREQNQPRKTTSTNA